MGDDLAAARDEIARLRLMLGVMEEGVSLLDADLVVVELNPAAHVVMGMHVTEEPGRLLFDNVEDLGWVREDGSPFPASEQPTPVARRTGIAQRDVLVGRPLDDGGTKWIRISAYPVAEPGAEPHAVVTTVRDVTAEVEAEHELRRLALHDPLTGLANRAMLLDRLQEVLEGDEREGAALLYCDLDRFKVVNDSLGHSVGDELLTIISRRIQAEAGPGDLAARLGGDELVLLVTGKHAAAEVDAVAATMLEVISQPVDLGAHTVVTGASIGIVELAAGATPEEVLRDADTAMYVAKGAGRGRAARYTDDLRLQAMQRLELEAELRAALRDDGLRLEYQPIVDLATDEIRKLEALVRWQHPTAGLLMPDSFMRLAEETGLVDRLGQWVLDHACAELAASGMADIPVAVNASALQLLRPSFANRAATACANAGLPTRRLCIELTESVLLEGGRAVMDELEALRFAGIQIALDDFGTGWSSLTSLQRFPFDSIKIDASFVAGVGEGVDHTHDDRVIVQAVIGLAAGLGREVVAEGVETEAQRAALFEMGCGYGQGYLFGRPQPIDEIAATVAARAACR